MICPHCGVGVRIDWRTFAPGIGEARAVPFDDFRWKGDVRHCIWEVRYCPCPECGRLILGLYAKSAEVADERLNPLMVRIWPRHANPKPISPHVPPEIASEAAEARNVLEDSPKSSAALSRRLLQRILVDKGGTKPGDDLSVQIDAVLSLVPSYLQKSLHGIRTIGNFAAHPLKSKQAATILDVEPGEAEWSLDTLDEAIDFYYVRPEVERQRIDDHNKKLKEAGKPPLK